MTRQTLWVTVRGSLGRISRQSLLNALLISVIMAATFWGYVDVLDDFFIMDDFDMIRGHSSFEHFIRHWSTPVGANTYRPLIDLLFIWDFYWWEWNPVGWHLSNVLFHILNSVLVYVLTKRLSDSVFAAWVAGMLFGLHACHTEAVTWISARMDVVCTTFFLASVLAFITYARTRASNRARGSSAAYLWSLCWFMCGLLVKEMAVTLPGVLMLYDAIFHPSGRSKTFALWSKLKTYTPYALVLLLYFALRAHALSGTGHYNSQLRGVIGGYQVQLFGLFVFENIVWYWRFLAIPFAEQIFSPSLVLNLIGITVWAAICLTLSRVSRFAILWIFVTLLPVYSLTIGRGVYLASVGFCALAGLILTFSIAPSGPGGRRSWARRTGYWLLRGLQIAVILLVVLQYASALRKSNAWWGGVAEINKTVPLMVKALHPTFPYASILCIQNMPHAFNQRFNSAFDFQFPDHGLSGIDLQAFERCIHNHASNGSAAHVYFLYYDRGVLYDLSVETRDEVTQAVFTERLSPASAYTLSPQHGAFTVTLPPGDDHPYAALGVIGSLATGIDVAHGTIVASGQILFDDDSRQTFTLVAGDDLAEWAIRFPQNHGIVLHQSPPAFRSWTVAQPKDSFAVAQNYRALLDLPGDRRVVSVEFERSATLAASDAVVAIDRLIFYAIHPEYAAATTPRPDQ
jgi:hypothetical protein